jgi:hypothetical protein
VIHVLQAGNREEDKVHLSATTATCGGPSVGHPSCPTWHPTLSRCRRGRPEAASALTLGILREHSRRRRRRDMRERWRSTHIVGSGAWRLRPGAPRRLAMVP